MRILPILAAATAAAAIATPAMAQSPHPYPYPQPQQYQYPQGQYPQPGYGYPGQSGYGQPQGGIAGIINQMLGNNYAQNDRHAVTQCATAAQAQADRQHHQARARTQGQPPYGNAYGYYAQQPMARVTAITNVNRTRSGLRVTGMMDSGMYAHRGAYGAYGQQGYGQQGYHPAHANADLGFNCTVDRRGVVTGLRVNRLSQHRR